MLALPPRTPSRRARRLATAAVLSAAVVLTSPVLAGGDPAAPPRPAAQPTTQELIDKMAALQARLDQVERERAAEKAEAAARSDAAAKAKADPAAVPDAPLTLDRSPQAGPAAADARARADAAASATAAQIGQDAAVRSQLLQNEGFTAGYTSGKFILQSADGRFVLNPNVGVQIRGVYNQRGGGKGGGSDDDTQSGFELRRLKLAFDGNIFTPDLTYRFQWNTNRKTGALELDEGWARYQIPETPFAVRAGSMGNTWDHETEVSYKRQMAVERTLGHDLLTSGGVGGEDYVQGVQLLFERDNEDPVRAFVMLHDGINSRNTNFQDGGGGAPILGIASSNYAVSGRVEYKVAGSWGNYRQFTPLGNKEGLLVAGAGFDYEDADNLNALYHTVDVQWSPGAVKGLSFYAAYVGLYRDFRNVDAAAGVTDTPYDWFAVAQVSYLLNDHWELFARYDYTDLDANAPTGANTLGAAARIEDKIHEITVGANYYLYGHSAKFTVDATYLPNGSPIGLDSAGILAQPSSKDQFLFRGQFQLLL